jgi:uncharacterized protein (DUF4213/DUF364 family)
MPYLSNYRRLIKRIDNAIRLPPIARVLLPVADVAEDIKDNFGFVVLSDGSTGPFYSCLGDTLEWLRQNAHHSIGESPSEIAGGLDGIDLPRSALALGAFNALSQYLMKRAGFDPTTAGKPDDGDRPEGRVGMVGFFRPLIERYLARGTEVIVIEQQPERVPPELGLELFTTPQALARCDTVLCTASTLINNSIESIVEAAGNPAKIHLIGPSASGLPDLLFDLGIRSTGGVIIDRPRDLERAIAQGDSWGDCGRKYQLTRESYPGLDSLLRTACREAV